MRLKEENLELRDIVKSYNLRGFSFREFLNLHTGMKFRAYSLEEILSNHERDSQRDPIQSTSTRSFSRLSAPRILSVLSRKA